MSTQLQRIQKIFRVFYALARAAKILCIVGASVCAVSALCVLTEAQGGQVFGLFGEPVRLFSGAADRKQAVVELAAAAIQLIADAILFALAQSYLKAERADGTPFTEQGAGRLKALGIHCIWIPLVAIVIAEVIAVSQGLPDAGEIGNSSEVITGIILILASGIFRYGAELEQKVRAPE